MSVLTVPYLAGALLLLVAGLSKVVSPDSTVDAARSVGLPAGRWSVQLLAAGEVVAGASALLVDSWVAGLAVGLSYVGFAGFLAHGLLRGGLDSCGCFAGDRAEPSWFHVIVDVAFAGAAFTVAADAGAGSMRASFAAGHGLTTAVLVVVVSALAYLVLSRLPDAGTVPARLLLESQAGAR